MWRGWEGRCGEECSDIYLWSLRNSGDAEFRMFFTFRMFNIQYGSKKNSTELSEILLTSILRNPAEFRDL